MMTQTVHIANTNVEFEFAHSNGDSLEISLSHNPLVLQLQFLPLLYALQDDIAAVTALPEDDFLEALKRSEWVPQGLPQMALFKEIEPFQDKKCISWGPSLKVKQWAETRKMNYPLPDWETARLVNSKAFSYSLFHLQESALIENEESLREWMKNIRGPKVLKTCYGLSGTGNRVTHDEAPSNDLISFCRKEWEQKRPIIGEPWLERICDFSTQWLIHPDSQIEWIGATRFETDFRGTYQGTLAGPGELLFPAIQPFLEEHREVALKALKEIAKKGFYGPAGVDAFLYRYPATGTICLHPLVEINGRETMSLVALRMQRRICPDRIFRLSFSTENSSQISLLPSRLLNGQGKMVNFRKRLIGTVLQKSMAIPFQ